MVEVRAQVLHWLSREKVGMDARERVAREVDATTGGRGCAIGVREIGVVAHDGRK